MRRPPSLSGSAAGGAYICDDWELRITGRCLSEDLNADGNADFEDVVGLKIVRAFVRERRNRIEGGREVSPLQCGCKAFVVAHQHDLRGATIHDPHEEVVWLVAAGLHRSGQAGDFYPYCKELDAEERLLPTPEDVERLIRERDRRFVQAVALEAPGILATARAKPGEHRHLLGGDVHAAITVEVVPGIEAITIAFQFDAIDWDSVPVLLAAFHPSPNWEPAAAMPSRPLEPGEVAMTVLIP